jgi:hypothetical protein
MVLIALPILARLRIAELLPHGGLAGEGVS